MNYFKYKNHGEIIYIIFGALKTTQVTLAWKRLVWNDLFLKLHACHDFAVFEVFLLLSMLNRYSKSMRNNRSAVKLLCYKSKFWYQLINLS